MPGYNAVLQRTEIDRRGWPNPRRQVPRVIGRDSGLSAARSSHSKISGVGVPRGDPAQYRATAQESIVADDSHGLRVHFLVQEVFEGECWAFPVRSASTGSAAKHYCQGMRAAPIYPVQLHGSVPLRGLTHAVRLAHARDAARSFNHDQQQSQHPEARQGRLLPANRGGDRRHERRAVDAEAKNGPGLPHCGCRRSGRRDRRPNQCSTGGFHFLDANIRIGVRRSESSRLSKATAIPTWAIVFTVTSISGGRTFVPSFIPMPRRPWRFR